MKPHLIDHMATSIDGRTLPSRWRPRRESATSFYEHVHEHLEGDAWLVGRVTGQEFAKRDAYPDQTTDTLPRESWIAKRQEKSYAVVLDPRGRIAWGRADIGGDPIVVVLTKQVADAHLAGLRADGVSYVFAGESDLDMAAALETLNRELGVERILLERGGVTNGAFLRGGLVDEISVLVCPFVDGAPGAPALFDAKRAEEGETTFVRNITLKKSEVFEGGVVWLHYQVTR